MASHTTLKVAVTGRTDRAIQVIFYEDLPEEQELWVPLSVLEDPDIEEDDDGDAEITIAKWFLIKNDIPYEHDPRDPEEPTR